jgi:hypothetical protein
VALAIGPPGPWNTLPNVSVMADTNAAWGLHSGIYQIPAGQTLSRFQCVGGAPARQVRP